MRLPSWISKSTETNDREDGVRRLRDAAWPDMFANLQSAYAELVFVEENWPDFDEAAFRKVLEDYSGRDRRFGGVEARR